MPHATDVRTSNQSTNAEWKEWKEYAILHRLNHWSVHTAQRFSEYNQHSSFGPNIGWWITVDREPLNDCVCCRQNRCWICGGQIQRTHKWAQPFGSKLIFPMNFIVVMRRLVCLATRAPEGRHIHWMDEQIWGASDIQCQPSVDLFCWQLNFVLVVFPRRSAPVGDTTKRR